MERIIKFRGRRVDNGQWAYGYLVPNGLIIEPHYLTPLWIATGHEDEIFPVDPKTVGQFTGLTDKNGKEIYEGDIIQIREPYRTTQTHTGDNIPNGSYTEPMEPAIRTIVGEVVFNNAMFQLSQDVKAEFLEKPLQWNITSYTEEMIKEAISCSRPGMDIWDDPEEGDLPYLLEEYKLKDLHELITYVSGVEIIGDIHSNPDLLT